LRQSERIAQKSINYLKRSKMPDQINKQIETPHVRGANSLTPSSAGNESGAMMPQAFNCPRNAIARETPLSEIDQGLPLDMRP
jgi:hypothetical protein